MGHTATHLPASKLNLRSTPGSQMSPTHAPANLHLPAATNTVTTQCNVYIWSSTSHAHQHPQGFLTSQQNLRLNAIPPPPSRGTHHHNVDPSSTHTCFALNPSSNLIWRSNMFTTTNNKYAYSHSIQTPSHKQSIATKKAQNKTPAHK